MRQHIRDECKYLSPKLWILSSEGQTIAQNNKETQSSFLSSWAFCLDKKLSPLLFPQQILNLPPKSGCKKVSDRDLKSNYLAQRLLARCTLIVIIRIKLDQILIFFVFRLLISARAATSIFESTPTSKADSTELQKSYSEPSTGCQLICGH